MQHRSQNLKTTRYLLTANEIKEAGAEVDKGIGL